MQAASKILNWREGSSMTSHWREYLCLQRGRSKHFKIFVGGYASISDADLYYNQNLDSYILPTHIDEKIVMGIEECSAVGGEPEYYDEDN